MANASVASPAQIASQACCKRRKQSRGPHQHAANSGNRREGPRPLHRAANELQVVDGLRVKPHWFFANWSDDGHLLRV
jgi:hypothetical protein